MHYQHENNNYYGGHAPPGSAEWGRPSFSYRARRRRRRRRRRKKRRKRRKRRRACIKGDCIGTPDRQLFLVTETGNTCVCLFSVLHLYSCCCGLRWLYKYYYMINLLSFIVYAYFKFLVFCFCFMFLVICYLSRLFVGIVFLPPLLRLVRLALE